MKAGNRKYGRFILMAMTTVTFFMGCSFVPTILKPLSDRTYIEPDTPEGRACVDQLFDEKDMCLDTAENRKRRCMDWARRRLERIHPKDPVYEYTRRDYEDQCDDAYHNDQSMCWKNFSKKWKRCGGREE